MMNSRKASTPFCMPTTKLPRCSLNIFRVSLQPRNHERRLGLPDDQIQQVFEAVLSVIEFRAAEEGRVACDICDD